jgi:outer membrane receptor protein involved in Fe transport
VENRIPGKFLEWPGGAAGDARIAADALVWNASLSYQLHAQHVFFGNASTGFRAPGIDDLGTLGLVDFRYERPAYGLQPERNIHYEIGYRYQRKRVRLQAAVFYMELKDLISRVRKGTDSIQGYPVYIKVNDQQAFIKGFESSASYEPLPGLVLTAMVAAQYGQNLTRDEPLRRIPPTHGLGGIRYGRHSWYAAIDMQWALKQERLAQGDKDDNRIPVGGTPGWQVFNLLGGYQGKGMELRATVSNIFNEDYRTHGSGIHGMGRALTLSVMFNFMEKTR